MNWKFSYAIGFHPWEDTDQEFFQSLVSLLKREEQGCEPPYGRALDIGTGSAIWGIELAKRGWEVTGVDFVGKALDRGRERVRAAGAASQPRKLSVSLRCSSSFVAVGLRRGNQSVS